MSRRHAALRLPLAAEIAGAIRASEQVCAPRSAPHALPQGEEATVPRAGRCRSARRGAPGPDLLGSGSELETGADVHHRSATRADRPDDLFDIDALKANLSSWTHTNARAALGSRATARPPTRARERARGGAGAARTYGERRPRARTGAAPHAQPSPTTAARALARPARPRATRPDRRAMARGGRSTPRNPSRPPGACCTSPGERESRRVADRDRTRSTTPLPGFVVRRATARRSARGA